MTAESIENQRLNLVKDLLRKRLQDSGKDSTTFSFKELDNDPLLSNRMATEKAIKKICERSGGNITFREVKSEPTWVSWKNNDTSAVNTRYGQEGPPVQVPAQMIGYEILVADPNRLEDYFSSIPTTLSFDPVKSRLYVRGTEIKIRKLSDQYHTLRVIFAEPKDVAQEWFFSDIAERVDAHKPNEKTYYNAIYQVGLKLATAGFPDFFKTTRQSLQINTKYLS